MHCYTICSCGYPNECHLLHSYEMKINQILYQINGLWQSSAFLEDNVHLKKMLRDVTGQEVIAKNLRSFLTSLHVRSSHGRSCTRKVLYATQVELIK